MRRAFRVGLAAAGAVACGVLSGGVFAQGGQQATDAHGFQRARGRHLHTGFSAHKTVNQFAVGAVTGNDHGPVVAATERELPAVQPQSGHLLGGPVATDAAAGHDRGRFSWNQTDEKSDQHHGGNPGGPGRREAWFD